MKERVLVVEDEEDIQALLGYNLAKEGYQVEFVATGNECLEKIHEFLPEVVLLDLMLPDMNGLEVCKSIRRSEGLDSVAVIMVTAKAEEMDMVLGLEVGADDYIPKPFSPRVLLARIRSVLRRRKGFQNNNNTSSFSQDVLQVHQLSIHPGKYEVFVGQEKIQLTYSEFQILYLLAQKAGWVFSRNQILDHIRGHDYIATDRTIDVQIASIRKKLKGAAHLIETVRGVGYRMKEE
ncbi:MAG: DNA-binding response regulator [Planctomycetota bacterium]|nr:MAG: DNA-binding response regulator [Planctomycetota bacterium]